MFQLPWVCFCAVIKKKKVMEWDGNNSLQYRLLADAETTDEMSGIKECIETEGQRAVSAAEWDQQILNHE